MQKKMPITWTIGSSDSSGGSGIQSDLHTFHDFSVHGCTVVTALHAQNSFARGHSVATERKNVVAQINALDSDMPASAIKLGAVPNRESLETVIKYFDDYSGFVCYDLELENCGEAILKELGLLKSELFPRIDLLVANIREVEEIYNHKIIDVDTMKQSAKLFLASGARGVLITGAQFDDSGLRHDYWSDGKDSRWLCVDAVQTVNNQGGGCVYTAAITAMMARGADIQEALVLAKTYVTKGISGALQMGSGPGTVAHLGFPVGDDQRPVVSERAPL